MFSPFIFKTPPRRQIDPIECGAVCLGIILHAFGRYVSTKDLKDAINLSRKGSDAHSIIDGARKFSLVGEAKRLLASDLRKNHKPAILFFDGCHFVVFEGYFLQRYYINDPARGRMSLDAREFHRRYSKVALVFEKDKKFSRNVSPPEQRKFSEKSANIAFAILGIFAGVIFTNVGATISLLLKERTLTTVIVFLTLWLCALIIFCTVLWHHAIKRRAIYQCLDEIHHLENDLKKIPASFFDDVPFAIFRDVFISSITRATRAVKFYADVYFLSAFISVLIIALFMCSVSCGLLVAAYLFWCVGLHAFTPYSAQPIKKDSTFALVTKSKDFVAMGQEKILIRGLLEKSLAIFLPISSWISLKIFSTGIFFTLLTFLLSQLFMRGNITINDTFLVVVVSYIVAILGFSFDKKSPLPEQLASHSLQGEFHAVLKNSVRPSDVVPRLDRGIQQVAASLDPAIKPRGDIISGEPPVGDKILVSFNNVSFSYRGEEPLFLNMNFKILHHEILGVVASPRRGKSTLLRLIANKLLQTSGTITYFTSHQNMPRIGVIDEDADIMEGTLKDVLTFFDDQIDEERMIAALKLACAVDLFYNRPLGLLTPIKAHGKNISAGQKKRLLLAQALVHGAEMVVLDNFFAALDHATSLEILENLRKNNITTVFSSYQENELVHTDRVIIIEQEQSLIVDTHNHLITTNDDYKSLLSSHSVEKDT